MVLRPGYWLLSVADGGPTIDCITAFSKSRRNSLFGVWIISIATICSLRSTQKCVPYAPLQPNVPSDREVPRAIESVTTRTLKPQPSPFVSPGSVSGAFTIAIISMLLGDNSP